MNDEHQAERPYEPPQVESVLTADNLEREDLVRGHFQLTGFKDSRPGRPEMPAGQYTRSADATASAVGERIVLYHRVSRTAIVLNPTGGWMWQRLSEPSTAAELTAALRQRFPSLTIEDAERDVTSFLDNLNKHSMVSVG